MFVFEKDGITMQVASEIQAVAFRRNGWKETGTVEAVPVVVNEEEPAVVRKRKRTRRAKE